MARYKEYDYTQGKFIPIHFERQIFLGSLEYRFLDLKIIKITTCVTNRGSLDERN